MSEAERGRVVEVVEEVEAPIDEPEEPAEDDDDEWNAEAEWEGELAYRVFSGQGAFDVEEIDIATEPQPADERGVAPRAGRSRGCESLRPRRWPRRRRSRRSPKRQRLTRWIGRRSEDRDPLADLPRQALFDMAKELGVPMKDLIVMDREQLIEAIHRAEPRALALSRLGG